MPKLDTIIAIKPEPETGGRRKGVYRPGPDELLGRRRIERDNYVYLRVWDVGQLAGGTDRGDLVYQWDPVATSVGSSTFTRNLTWNADVLATPYESWPGLYREITSEIADYNLSVVGYGVYDPARGAIRSDLPVTDAVPQPRVVAENKYFLTWLSAVNSKYKFTRNPTYSDTAVIFAADRDIDLFLLPMPHYRYAIAVYEGDPGDDLDDHTKRMYAVQAALPRSTRDDPEFDAIWANRVNASAGSVIDIAYYRDLLLNDRSPDMYNYPGPILSDTSGFPTGSDHPDAEWTAKPRLGFEPAFRFDGLLVAAIRKRLSDTEFEWYFVWTKTQQSGSDPNAIGAFGSWAYGNSIVFSLANPELHGILV